MEMRGVEPRASRNVVPEIGMRSERSTTELHPQQLPRWVEIKIFIQHFIKRVYKRNNYLLNNLHR